MPHAHHTAWILDWSESEQPWADFYPHAKRVRFNGSSSRVLTDPGAPSGDMWSGVMVDLNKSSSQSTWVAYGPVQN